VTAGVNKIIQSALHVSVKVCNKAMVEKTPRTQLTSIWQCYQFSKVEFNYIACSNLHTRRELCTMIDSITVLFYLRQEVLRYVAFVCWLVRWKRLKARIALNGIPMTSPTRHKWTPPSPSTQAGTRYLRQKDGRLSWPRLPGSGTAGSRTGDLSITSPTP